MRTLKIAFLTAGIACLCASIAYSATYAPADADLSDLPHGNYFAWVMKLTVPAGETIQSASLSFKNIYNWDANPNVLSIHLLDPKASVLNTNKVYTYTDTDGGTDAWSKATTQSDKFASTRPLIGTWSDLDTPYGLKHNVVFNFSAADIASLNTFAADGYVALGIDPDCHYYNDGVSFTVNTGSRPGPDPCVPEIPAAALAPLGLAAFGFIKRRITK